MSHTDHSSERSSDDSSDDFADFHDDRASAPTLGIPFRGESLLAVCAAAIGVIVAIAAVTAVARKPASYAFQGEAVLQACDSDQAMRTRANEHPAVIDPRAGDLR